MDDKLLNPIYTWVAESLLTEQAIAKEKDDLYGLALSLSCDFLYTKQLLTSYIKFLETSIEKTGYKVKDVAAMAICNHLGRQHKIGLNRNFHSNTANTIRTIYQKQVPLSMKASTYYFATQYKETGLEGLKQFLIDKRQELLTQGNMSALVEIEFALGAEYFSEELWKGADNDIVSFDVGKKAKVALLFLEKNSVLWERYLGQIERKCYEKTSEASLPLISLLVYEAEKLISTNLPTDKLNEVLDSLKKKNKVWAQLISEIQQRGVTLDLNRIQKISGLNVEESCWVLQLLERSGRKETYQISKTDKEKLTEYKELTKNNTSLLPSQAVLSYLFYTTIWTFLAFLYFESFGFGQVRCILTSNCQLQTLKTSTEQIGDYISLPIACGIIAKYYIYSWKNLITKKEFNIKSVFSSLFAIKLTD